METINCTEPVPVTAPLLCVRCAHIATSRLGGDNHKCLAPSNPSKLNLVTGEREYLVQFCSSHRDIEVPPGINTHCGISASWFEKAPDRPSQQEWNTSLSGVEESTKAKLILASRRAAKITLDDL